MHDESLRNLQFPLDWEGIVRNVGLPCVLKDAHGGGWKEVYVCQTLEELIHHYDQSGLLTMIVQEFIQWEQFVRCICLGQEEILPMQVRSQGAALHPGPRLPRARHCGERVVDDSPDARPGAGLRHELDRVGRFGTACPTRSTS